MKRHLVASMFALTFVSLACSISPAKAPPRILDVASSGLTVAPGAPVIADGAHPLTVRAVVMGSDGHPMSGVLVALRLVAEAPFASGKTDANGSVSARFTSTHAGTYRFEADVQFNGQTLTLLQQGSSVMVAGAASTLVFQSLSPSQTAGGQFTAAVAMLDANGNVVQDDARPISVRLADAQEHLGGGTSAVPTEGVASFGDLTILHSGTYVLTAEADGLEPAVSTPIQIVAGPASEQLSTFTVSSPAVPADGVTQVTASAHLVDGYGNPCSGALVRVDVDGNDAVMDPSSAWRQADANGDLSFAVASAYAETKTLMLFAGEAAYARSVAFLPGPPDASRTTLTVPSSPPIADEVSRANVTLTVRDAFGNPLQGVAYGFTVSGVGLYSPTGLTGYTDGKGQGHLLFGSWIATVKHVTATMPFAMDTDVTFVPGPPAILVWASAPVGAIAGERLSTTRVSLQDAFGNVETAWSGTATVSLEGGGNGVLSGTLARPLENGVATFDDLSFNRSAAGVMLVASADGFTRAGPAFDISGWRRTGPAGPVYALDGIPGVAWIAGTSAGVFTNNGQRWTPADTGLGFLPVSAVLGYATLGTAQAAILGTTDGHVYVSPLGASLTWSDHSQGLNGAVVQKFWSNGPSTFAATSQGVFATSGGDWSARNVGLTDVDLTAAAASPLTDHWLVGTASGHVFESRDAGGSWSGWPAALPGRVTGIAFDNGSSNGAAFASVEGLGLYRSDDSGATWVHDDALPSSEIVRLEIRSDDSNWVVTRDLGLIAFRDADGPQVIGSGSFPPVNDFLYWFTNRDPLTFAYLLATDDGVFTSTQEAPVWTSSSDGLSATTVRALTATSSQNVFASTTVGLYVSRDGAETWSKTSLPSLAPTALAVSPVDAQILWAATADQGLFRSTDGALTWTPANGAITATDLVAVAIDPGDPSKLYAASASAGVFRSTDGGDTWSPASAGLSALKVTSLLIDGSTIDVTTQGGGVFQSTDGALTWSAANTGLASLNATSVMRTGSRLIVGTDQGLFSSDDDGGNWTEVASPGSTIQALVADAATGRLFAGTAAGLLRSDDAGASWYDVSSGMPDANVGALVVTPGANGALLAGTGHLGVLRSFSGGL